MAARFALSFISDCPPAAIFPDTQQIALPPERLPGQVIQGIHLMSSRSLELEAAVAQFTRKRVNIRDAEFNLNFLGHYACSKANAIPMPPLTHRVATPRRDF